MYKQTAEKSNCLDLLMYGTILIHLEIDKEIEHCRYESRVRLKPNVLAVKTTRDLHSQTLLDRNSSMNR